MEGGREDKRNARRLRADLDRCLQAPSTRSPHHASSTLLMLFLSSSFSFSFSFSFFFNFFYLAQFCFFLFITYLIATHIFLMTKQFTSMKR
jgi:hypothetical protein